jgi:hypothetical protein
MVFETLYNKEKDYLYWKYKGNESDLVIKSLHDVFQNCKKWDYKKLIIDLKDFDFDIVTTMTRFKFGEEVAKLSNEIYRVKVGVLLNKKDYDGIGEVAAQNRGAWAKAFFNEDDALKWLFE